MLHKLYHAGIRGRVSRSTLADANETRSWRICADFTRMDGLNRGKAFFVTRTKRNMEDTRLTSSMIDKSTVLRSDQTIRLHGSFS